MAVSTDANACIGQANRAVVYLDNTNCARCLIGCVFKADFKCQDCFPSFCNLIERTLIYYKKFWEAQINQRPYLLYSFSKSQRWIGFGKKKLHKKCVALPAVWLTGRSHWNIVFAWIQWLHLSSLEPTLSLIICRLEANLVQMLESFLFFSSDFTVVDLNLGLSAWPKSIICALTKGCLKLGWKVLNCFSI